MRPRPAKKLRGGTTREGALTTLLHSYRKNAHARGFTFLLTRAQCAKLFFSTCRYCGIEPGAHKCRGIPYNGIDRVDNSRGYVTKNVVTACGFCNQAKHGNSVQSFYEWIERISKHHGERHVSTEPDVQNPKQSDERAPQARKEGSEKS